MRASKLRFILADKLERGRLQPRRVIDGPALRKLAESIRVEGMIQPIFVRKGRGTYEIVAGERRWRAAKMAGLKAVPCVVANVSDDASLAIALIENLHREGLNPIDQALAMRRLVEEFSMTHRQIADAIGKSRSTITNLLRLLDLPDDVRTLVADGAIDMGHARALLALPNEMRTVVADRVARDQLSVRAVEQATRRGPAPAPVAPPGNSLLSEAVRRSLGGDAAVRWRKDGRWRLTVDFTDVDQLRQNLAALDALLLETERSGVAPSLVDAQR